MKKTLILAGVFAGWIPAIADADTPALPSAPGAAPATPAQDTVLLPAVRSLLDRTAKFYAAHHAFEADLASVTNMSAPGMTQKFESSFRLALERPNLAALTLQDGMMGGSIISDGKTLMTTMPMAHRYATDDAPAQLVEVFSPMRTALAGGGLGLGFESFLGPDAVAALTKELVSSEDLGAEPIGGQATDHVRLATKALVTDLWIADGDKPLILQAGVAPDLSGALKHLSAAQKAKMPPGFDSMKMSRLTTYSNWKIDGPIAASTFEVKPPAGFTVMDLGARAEKLHPLTGKPAPDFTLQDGDGKSVRLQSLRGKVVVLDFWATWCGPCREALPIISGVAASFKDKGVVFYAANQREDAATIRKFQADQKLVFPFLLDPDGKVGALYKANAIPESVLIDGQGKIEAVHVGYSPHLREQLTQQLTDMLAGKSLAAPNPTAPKAGP